MKGLDIVSATVDDTDVLHRLLQLYYFEASSWSGEEIGSDGLYDCDRSDIESALSKEPHWARLLWVDGCLCGFVLTDEVDLQGRRVQELADIFVLPKHRGKGIAHAVVAKLVTPDTGDWLLATFRKDDRALAFWRRNLPRMGMEFEVPAEREPDFNLFVIRASHAR